MRRTSLDAISLTPEQRRKMRELISDFVYEEQDREIGVIEQDSILDFFLESLAPVIYNAALEDARTWAHRTAENADADYYTLYKEEY